MRRRYKSARLQRIDDILEKTLKKYHLPLKTEDRRLRDVWLRAVGSRIAAQTKPDCIKKAVLFVKVANSVWIQQLHFMKQEIIEKFNDLHQTEPLKDIFFAVGEIAAAAVKTDQVYSADEMPALEARDKKMIEKSLSAIADEELRNILKRAMTKEVIRRRMMEKRQDR
ncbi:MAG: DUF721 domain-containing protein [Pseudomonadota bacterium]